MLRLQKVCRNRIELSGKNIKTLKACDLSDSDLNDLVHDCIIDDFLFSDNLCYQAIEEQKKREKRSISAPHR